MSGESNKNIEKSTVESDSTYNTGFRKVNNDGNIEGMTGARVSYADAVGTPAHREIVRRDMNMDLSSFEGQALGKPSEQSLSKLTKI